MLLLPEFPANAPTYTVCDVAELPFCPAPYPICTFSLPLLRLPTFNPTNTLLFPLDAPPAWNPTATFDEPPLPANAPTNVF